MSELVTQEQIERANWIAELLLDVRYDTPLDEIAVTTPDLKTLALVYLQHRPTPTTSNRIAREHKK